LQRFAQRLEGWPAGIVLALFPLPEDIARWVLNGEDGPETLFSALANSMLEAQPPELQHFLLSSSVLMGLRPDWCQHILGIANSAHLIQAIQTQNLFVNRTSGV